MTLNNREKAIADHIRTAAPVVADLQHAGFQIDSLDGLRRSGQKYHAAIPILTKWLPMIEALDVKESIIRSLSVSWAKGIATKAVLDEFNRAPSDAMNYKWAIGNAMEVLADNNVGDEILRIVAESEHGISRQMFVLALSKIDQPGSIIVLRNLLQDDEVAGHAAMALGRLKAVEAKREIESLAKRGKPWVRRAALKALDRIAKIENVKSQPF